MDLPPDTSKSRNMTQTSENYAAWLAGLKPGQEIGFRLTNNEPVISTVTSVTKKQIKTDCNLWNRKTGNSISTTSSGYGTPSQLIIPDTAFREEIQILQNKRKLYRLLEETKVEKLLPEEVLALKNLLEKIQMRVRAV